jgi:hypothetical protein
MDKQVNRFLYLNYLRFDFAFSLMIEEKFTDYFDGLETKFVRQKENTKKVVSAK